MHGERRARRCAPAAGGTRSTPFEIASTPVSAAEPGGEGAQEHEAASTRAGPGGERVRRRPPEGRSRRRTWPTPDADHARRSTATKPYVGSANEDARPRCTPRRFDDREQHDERERELDLVQPRSDGTAERDAKDAGGDRDCDREHVVGQKAAAPATRPRQRSEIVLRDHVRAAARLVGATVWRVRERRRSRGGRRSRSRSGGSGGVEVDRCAASSRTTMPASVA